jgi:hypothetical protein
MSAAGGGADAGLSGMGTTIGRTTSTATRTIGPTTDRMRIIVPMPTNARLMRIIRMRIAQSHIILILRNRGRLGAKRAMSLWSRSVGCTTG